MKYFIYLIALLMVVSCSKNQDTARQTYDIQVIDGITELPLSNALVQLSYGIGGTHALEWVEGNTDQNGMVSLSTSVDPDTIMQLLDESEYLNQSHVHQTINVDKEGYLLYEFFQDTVINIFRPFFEENKLITAKVYEYIPCYLKMIDDSPIRDKDVIFQYKVFQDHPSFNFPIYGSSLNVFRIEDPDTMQQKLFLGNGVNYKIDYSLSVVDTMNETLDTFFQSFIEFEGNSNVSNADHIISF